MRRTGPLAALAACAALAGCGGGTTQLIRGPVIGVQAKTPEAGQKLGFPAVATKNTTRVAGADPIADAAGVALAVYPSSGSGTHPPAVAIAPTDDWQAAVAASVLMATPVKAPLLLSGPSNLPSATADALKALAPAGAGATAGAQVLRIGDVPAPDGLKSQAIGGKDPFALAASIDRFRSAAAGQPSASVVVASADDPAYAMPAAGWAAESGDPILFVTGSTIPAPTRQALVSHQHPHIYVLGPASVVPDSLLKQLSKYGTVKRVAGKDPPANSVAFAAYRDPPCPFGQPCAHVPGSFGWALRSPGHGYTLVNVEPPARRRRGRRPVGHRRLRSRAARRRSVFAAHPGAELLPRLRHPRLHPGGTDRRGLQPRLGDRRPDRDLRSGPGRDGQPAGSDPAEVNPQE